MAEFGVGPSATYIAVVSAGNWSRRDEAIARVRIRSSRSFFRNFVMLMTIVAILVVLWIFGMVSAYTMGGLIHLLLVVAVIVVLVRVIQGRRPI